MYYFLIERDMNIYGFEADMGCIIRMVDIDAMVNKKRVLKGKEIGAPTVICDHLISSHN